MKKKYRIKKNHEIASIVNAKNKVVNKNFIIYYQKNDIGLRIALSVSKKYGKSFERNKAKRIARNIFRKHLNNGLNANLVVVIKPISKGEDYLVLEKEADFLLKLINKKIN